MPTESGIWTVALGDGAEVSAPGAAEIGDESEAAALELLQPGLERRRMSASAWTPAAIPRILIIFMGKNGLGRTGVRLSVVAAKAISNSGRMKLRDRPLKAIASVLVVAEHVEAGETRTEQHVPAGRRGSGGGPDGIVQIQTDRMGNAHRLKCVPKRRSSFADEDSVADARGDPARECRYVAAL